MGEKRDEELGRLLRQARPGPREGWRERALSALATAPPGRLGGWLRWAPTAAGMGLVVVALALLPYSAGTPGVSVQTTLGTQSAYAAQGPETAVGGDEVRPRPMDTLQEHLRPYVERAESFVRGKYRDDPEMLMAAGILTAEYQENLSLLKEAAEKGGGAEWAVYAGAAMSAGPKYWSPALRGVDPRDPDRVRQVRDEIEADGRPTALTEEEAEPVLEVLRGWEQADPGNGIPAALEVYYLCGLGREEEARERWEHAGAQPQSSLYAQETIWAMQRLLRRMGMSERDSASGGFSLGFEVRHAAEQTARRGATIARYEGRRAGAEGRYEDAFAWWNATMVLGRHMQESSDTAIEMLEAIVIEAVGASEIWRWRPDRETGIEGGPLDGGRLYQEPAYGEFVSRYGEEAARKVRDGLVRAKLRSIMIEAYSRDMIWLDPGLRSGQLLGISTWFGALLLVFVTVFAGASVWARRVADEATGLSRWVAAAIAVACLLPIGAVCVVLWWGGKMLFLPAGLAVALAAMPLSLLSPLFVPLIIVRWTRRGGARLRTVWRGNLRRVLPLAIAICAAVSLSAGIAGRRAERAWAARDWYSQTEMERVVKAIGPEWNARPIPPDAWRNEPPPEAESG